MIYFRSLILLYLFLSIFSFSSCYNMNYSFRRISSSLLKKKLISPSPLTTSFSPLSSSFLTLRSRSTLPFSSSLLNHNKFSPSKTFLSSLSSATSPLTSSSPLSNSSPSSIPFSSTSQIYSSHSNLSKNFITNIIEQDLLINKHNGKVITRFPPEPNGYLHLGHAKSINFNYFLAKKYNGEFNLRMDDTNPSKENLEYIFSILKDVIWITKSSYKYIDNSNTNLLSKYVTLNNYYIDENFNNLNYNKFESIFNSFTNNNTLNSNVSSSTLSSSALSSTFNSSSELPWNGPIRFASDYFPQMYEAARYLIKQGLAYVDLSSQEEMKELRGTLTTPGVESIYRTSHSIEDNLRLFEEMKDGKHPDGSMVLRAKIDMKNSNLNLRDPSIYRIKHSHPHPITGKAWCIYPLYDFAHALSDSFEGITHSLCSLEFENHRSLYDWVVESVKPSGILSYYERKNNENLIKSDENRNNQYEFSRLNLKYTVLSKRKLIQLVEEKHVNGWDDPRMPTISGLRRRGYPSEALALFSERIGISKAENFIELNVLEDCVREVCDEYSSRAFVLTKPLKITLTNYDEYENENKEEIIEFDKHPKHLSMGKRYLKFNKNLYIDSNDFFDINPNNNMTVPLPKGYKRLYQGGNVRLKHAYVITCNQVIRDPITQEPIELLCTYAKDTRSGASPPGSPKAKGIIQWLSEKDSVPVQVNLYDRLFKAPIPGGGHSDGNFLRDLNKDSLIVLKNCLAERSLIESRIGDIYQFERNGYFCLDQDSITKDNENEENKLNLIFNRVVTLKDTWEINLNQQEEIKLNKLISEKSNISLDLISSFKQIDIKVGQILKVEKHPQASNLLLLTVNCGDSSNPKTIISSISNYFEDYNQLINQKVLVVCNLKPIKMRGIVSEGMLLTSVYKENNNIEKLSLLKPSNDSQPGDQIYIEEFGENIDSNFPIIKSKTQIENFQKILNSLKCNNDKNLVLNNENSQFFLYSKNKNKITSDLDNSIVC